MDGWSFRQRNNGLQGLQLSERHLPAGRQTDGSSYSSRQPLRCEQRALSIRPICIKCLNYTTTCFKRLIYMRGDRILRPESQAYKKSTSLADVVNPWLKPRHLIFQSRRVWVVICQKKWQKKTNKHELEISPHCGDEFPEAIDCHDFRYVGWSVTWWKVC